MLAEKRVAILALIDDVGTKGAIFQMRAGGVANDVPRHQEGIIDGPVVEVVVDLVTVVVGLVYIFHLVGIVVGCFQSVVNVSGAHAIFS